MGEECLNIKTLYHATVKNRTKSKLALLKRGGKYVAITFTKRQRNYSRIFPCVCKNSKIKPGNDEENFKKSECM